jgi:hypothetical protein
MLAGEKVPETAVRHARELLAQAGTPTPPRREKG